MHDIRAIRAHQTAFEAAMAKRGIDASSVQALLEADAVWRATETEVQALQTRRNEVARMVAALKRAGEDAEVLVAEGREIGTSLPDLERARDARAAEVATLLLTLPNIALPDVPDGADETANVVTRSVGEATTRPWTAAHWDVAPAFGLDTEAGARLAGARFSVLRGVLARLERALGQFMVDLHVREHGREEVSVPHLVRPEILRGTGQLPKFEEDLFPAGEGRFMIPTAEVPLTNLVAGMALDPAALPLRMVALTPCYRAEAGAAGRDTRGLLRQHQFHKTELVTICAPEDADAEQDRMVHEAERVLELLGLPHRRLLLCAGDMGFAAARTIDLQVWMPGQGAWREISSISTCGEFQARRMVTRMKGSRGLPHTLNGSGVAVGRALAAVLENHLAEDGTVPIPEALRPYMGGLERLTPRHSQRQA